MHAYIKNLTLFREFDNIYYKENDPIMCKIKIARSLACKMMQQWFGNTVSSSWWSYLWLNDGISMLIGIEVLNKVCFFYIFFHTSIKFSYLLKVKMYHLFDFIQFL